MDYYITIPEFVEKFKEGKGLKKIPLNYVDTVGQVLEKEIKDKFSLLKDNIVISISISQARSEDPCIAEYEIHSKENNDLQYICSMNCIIG
jgi:hypothetical protein